MIHVLITVKPSTRFPGKNARLIGYTITWLAQEILYSKEEVRVYTVGERSELPCVLPPSWQHIQCLTGSHRGDIEFAEKHISPTPDDVLVLAQLTQPLRRFGLLGDVVNLVREYGSAVTACQARHDEWRKVDSSGSWNPVKGGRGLLHDGALFGWIAGNVGDIFSATVPHGVAMNYSGSVVDIDVKEDIPLGLPSAFGELLLRR